MVVVPIRLMRKESMNSNTWKADFDKKFHKRIWEIVKLADPSSYSIAAAYGTLDGEGPQIYGEIKEHIQALLNDSNKE